MRIENSVFFAPGIEFKELDWNDPIEALVVNPALLLNSIAYSIDNYLVETSSDYEKLNKFGNTLNTYFADDINYVKQHS